MLGLALIARTAAEIRRDVSAAQSRDPAAQGVSTVEILATWPGVHAVLAHRVAHVLHSVGVPLLPRLIAAVARSVTGIEIHPAARIGDGLFIDHGMGVVVGETAEIGNDVTIYQGVTLGGTGFATGKRHPTVQDNVTIGSNSVVIHNVPPNSTVVGNPGHPVRVEGRRPEGPDADWVHLPDPVADAIKGLASRIAVLEGTLAEVPEDANGAGGQHSGGAASQAPQPDGRANPALGPNPAGG